MRRLLVACLAAVSLATAVVGLRASPAGATVPAGFRDDAVASVGSPTAFAFTPDGRMLVTTQPGTVRVIKNQVLMQPVALNLSAKVCANSERGLLGIAVDPNFASNGFVFLYYSAKASPTAPCDGTVVNRVSRFVMTGDALGSETVLIDKIPSPAGNHNAGDLNFGKDGFLYVSVGDGGCDYAGGGCGGANDAARDEFVLVGKILRITRDGGIPPDNPFQGPGTGRCHINGLTAADRCQETFAWGLRNPFRMAFDPNAAGTRFYINDVGQAAWEEIDLGIAGADYGWNVREGHCVTGSTTNCGPPPAGMTNPIFDYGRSDTCRSITGGAFVPDGLWPAAYQGKYLFADFGCGKIFRLDPDGAGGFTRIDFATDLGGNSAVHLRFGPYGSTQALYYTTYAGGGQIRRIAVNGAVPAVTVAGFTWYSDGASSQSGPSGTVVRLFASQLKANTPYYLVTAPPEGDAALTCSRNLLAVNGSVRVSSASGVVGITAGAIGRGSGTWNVCFRSLDGTTVGAPVSFTVP